MSSGFGKHLKEYLEFYNISQSEFATRLNITQKHMNEILNGKTDISLDIALAIQNLTDIPVEFIIKSEYKKKIENYLYLKYSEEELKNMLKKRFLIKELEERGWIKFNNITNIVQNYIDIFEYLKVRDFEALDKINEKTLFKKTGDDINKLSLWIARCDNLSKQQKVETYIKENFNFLIDDLKKLAYEESIDIEKIQKLLNCYGIYFVVEKALTGSKVRGCFKVKMKNPAIYITKNYSGKDSFYYELFHELGHCKSDYNEAKSKVIVEGDEKKELRADNFAINTMISKDIWEEIVKDYSENNLKIISSKYKIPMSFIVGRLAKLNYIKYTDKLVSKYKEC